MAARSSDRHLFDRHLFAAIATIGIVAPTNANADDDASCTDADAYAFLRLMLLHMPLLMMLTPMQKCQMMLAILPVHLMWR